jgi:hypothetical protein
VSIKRAAIHDQQAELPFVVPVPARGTVIIMRIEDFRASPVIVRPPVAKRTEDGRREDFRSAGDDAAVAAWLSGHGDPQSYGARTERDDRGRVLITASEDAVVALPDAERYPLRGRLILLGNAMKRLGWSRRYISGRKRYHAYVAPSGWHDRNADAS